MFPSKPLPKPPDKRSQIYTSLPAFGIPTRPLPKPSPKGQLPPISNRHPPIPNRQKKPKTTTWGVTNSLHRSSSAFSIGNRNAERRPNAHSMSTVQLPFPAPPGNTKEIKKASTTNQEGTNKRRERKPTFIPSIVPLDSPVDTNDDLPIDLQKKLNHQQNSCTIPVVAANSKEDDSFGDLPPSYDDIHEDETFIVNHIVTSIPNNQVEDTSGTLSCQNSIETLLPSYMDEYEPISEADLNQNEHEMLPSYEDSFLDNNNSIRLEKVETKPHHNTSDSNLAPMSESDVKARLEYLRNAVGVLPPPPTPGDWEDDNPYDDDDNEYEEDDEEDAFIMAMQMAEMEIEENATDSLEESKIVVRWGNPGDPPPVPSREDPSYNLSECQALQFLKQKEEIPDSYKIILEDPRLKRLRLKWCPNVFTKDGAVQFAKNKVDPATIPYVGFLFHVNRVREAGVGRMQMQKIANDENLAPELEESMDAFKGATVARCVQEAAYTGVAAACMTLPMIDIVPGLSAQLMILGEIGAGVAETGIEMGLKVVISKSSGKITSALSANTDAFTGFGSSKAFLTYLGYPSTDDPLYSQWEPHRLKLKALYGCTPSDDVSKMKPKGELLRKISAEEDRTGKPYEIEVPLLILLWRAFDCWHTLYYDRAIGLRDNVNGKTRNLLGLRRNLTIAEKRRMRDYRYLRKTAAVIESKEALHPQLQILPKARKKEIIELLTDCYLHSYHVAYLFSRKKLRSEQRENLQWFMKMVVDYFFAHNAFFWGYVNTDNRIVAVAIWESPNERASISFLSMLRTSGAFKLGPNRWKKMSDILFKLENIRTNDIRGLHCWMLHHIGVHPQYQKQGIARLLIENTVRRHSEPVYIQLFDIEEDMVQFLKRMCFIPVRHAEAKFKLYGIPVTAIAYWYGIQSPTELKALLPAKKKNPLQLTYNSIRKKTQQRAALQQNTFLLDSTESKLLSEAQLRYEETATLLDHLKMDLASLPTEGRDTDPLAQSLITKVKEYQHLVTTYKASLDDAKQNVKLVSGQQ